MNGTSNGPDDAPGHSVVEKNVRLRLARALRVAPTLAAMALWAALIGACGNSVYSKVSNSPTPTATITTSPGTGNFLYSSNFADGEVAEFTRNLTTGTLTLSGSVGAGSANGPVGIATGRAAKYIYVVNSVDDNVRQFKVNLTSGALSPIGTGKVAAGSSPQWIAVTPNAQFAFVTNFGGGTISPYTINATTGALSANGGAFSSALLKNPATAVASNNWLYVTDDAKGTIVSFPIDSTGALSAGTTTTLSAGAIPGPVIMNPSGQFVYTTDEAKGVVYFLKVGTGVLTLANSYVSTTAGSVGLAIAKTPAGNLYMYVANQTAVPPSLTAFLVNGDGTLTFLSPPQYADPSLFQPTGVAVDPTGSFLYVANQGNSTISQFAISSTTGALSLGVPVGTESATSGPLYLTLAN